MILARTRLLPVPDVCGTKILTTLLPPVPTTDCINSSANRYEIRICVSSVPPPTEAGATAPK